MIIEINDCSPKIFNEDFKILNDFNKTHPFRFKNLCSAQESYLEVLLAEKEAQDIWEH